MVTKAKEHTFGEAPHNLRFLFLLSIAVQLVDVFLLRFDRTTFLLIAVVMYLTLAALAFLFFKGEGGFVQPFDIFKFVLISVFYIAVPFFLYLVPNISVFGGTTLAGWVSFFLAIIPVWPIYIGIKAEIPFVHHYVNFWIVFLLFFFIFLWGTQLNPSFFTNIGGRPELLQAGEVFNYLTEKTVGIWQRIVQGVDVGIGRLENMTGIPYYTSMIDGTNDKPPVGLYLRNVKADQYNFVGQPAEVRADIQGKSFTKEIIFTPTCYVDEKTRGEPTPQLISIFGSETDIFYCKFDNLSKGSYSVKVGGGFTFDTWAYVEYVFVDMDVRRSMEMAGQNINSKLNIPVKPKSIYTPGPVMLGMSPNIEQPFSIDLIGNTREPPLGVTIQNSWSEGKIDRPLLFMIMVPDDFDLVKCNRGEPEKSVGDGYTNYTFDVEKLGDLRLNFDTVECRLHVKDPRTLLAGAQKAQRTFVGMVRYKYKLEKSVSINVRE